MAKPLRFRSDDTFTIVQFTDLHVQNGEPEDMQTAELMAAILDAEQPDLIALTGDIISGRQCKDPAESWRRAVAPIIERELPWTAMFGNHDDEGSHSRAQLMDLQRQLPYCLSEPGPDNVSGVGNYVLEIASANSDKPAASLYFLDSNAYSETRIAGYGWIRRDQIEWFMQEAAHRLPADGQPLPSLAFFHIPLPEYNQVWDMHECYGHKYEPVCCPLVNTGFYAAMHEVGGFMGAFVGHDHINDFDGNLYGIRLCFGRGTGYNTYGKDGFKRGARIIRLRNGEHEFDSWLRLEGGDIVHQQPLHKPEFIRKTCIL